MRQGSNGRRPRGRPQRKQHGGTPRHGNFDSSGPEGRIRGNAHQVYEKYIGLARDATSLGDRIAAETYFQHAEHYYRIVNARTDSKPDGPKSDGSKPDGPKPDGPKSDGSKSDGAKSDGDGQSGRRGGNGQVEAAGEAAPGNAGEQANPAAFNGEQPREAPQAPDRPAGHGRRKPRQAKAAEPQLQPQPQPDPQPEAQTNSEVQAGKDGEPAEN